jgi:hypothetical protein
MIAHLQEYLLLHGKVKLPGAGFLSARLHPARYEVSERAFVPPSCELHWQEEDDDFMQQPQMAFLAQKLDLSEEDVYEHFHEVAYLYQTKISNGEAIDLGALGQIRNDEQGKLKFVAPVESIRPFESLAAERVIRQGVAHQMVVGDNETTTTDMEAYFTDTPEEKDRWWWLPLTIGLIALALIVWKRIG